MPRGLLSSRALALLLVTTAVSACGDSPTVIRDAGTEPPKAELESITVSATSRMITKSETLALVATGRYDDGTTRALTDAVTWSSSTSTVATVNASGVVTAIDVGAAELTAAIGTVRGAIVVTVVASPLAALAIEPSAATLTPGETTTLVARGTFEDGTTRDVTTSVVWSSSASAIATVDAGLVTGLTTGTAIISARDEATGVTSGSASATIEVVAAAPVSLRVDPVGVSLPVGETQAFTATAVYADGSTVDVTTAVSWSSSNASVGSVANAPPASGTATGLAAGLTSITATDRETGLMGSVSLIVTEARLVSLEVTPRTATIAVGARTTLAATGAYSSGATIDVTRRVAWTSSNTSVATVDVRGQVTPLVAGATTISARDATSGLDTNTLGTSARITVSPPTVTSVAVIPLSQTIAVGDTLQLQGLALYSDTTNRDCTASGAWASSAPSVATVDAAGLVTAVGAGDATISVVDDVSGVASAARSSIVTVTPPALRALAVTPPTSAVVTGNTRQLAVLGTFSDGSTSPVLAATVTWRSSAPSIVSVSASGLVTGLAPGLATISVTDVATQLSSDAASSALVSVSNANLVSLAIEPGTAVLPAGADLALTAIGTYDDTSTADLTSVVTWASSTSTVARVSNTSGERGKVTALARARRS